CSSTRPPRSPTSTQPAPTRRRTQPTPTLISSAAASGSSRPGGTRRMSRSKTLPSGEPRPRYDAERLLDVAARVFTERGYDGTSMEDLSRASGLSKSSLYLHVASKEQLLRRALE